MAPHVLSVVAPMIVARKATDWRALIRSWRKGER
jgi:hypothetical protein